MSHKAGDVLKHHPPQNELPLEAIAPSYASTQ